MANTLTVPALIGPFEARPLMIVAFAGIVVVAAVLSLLPLLPHAASANTARHKTGPSKYFAFIASSLLSLSQ
jgi:hypothetical protein